MSLWYTMTALIGAVGIFQFFGEEMIQLARAAAYPFAEIKAWRRFLDDQLRQ